MVFSVFSATHRRQTFLPCCYTFFSVILNGFRVFCHVNEPRFIYSVQGAQFFTITSCVQLLLKMNP